jgi:hypothetical protein
VVRLTAETSAERSVCSLLRKLTRAASDPDAEALVGHWNALTVFGLLVKVDRLLYRTFCALLQRAGSTGKETGSIEFGCERHNAGQGD